MIYKLKIEKTVCDEFDVEADSEEEAFGIAVDNYNSGEFVLEPGELTDKQMLISDEKGNHLIGWGEL